MGRYISEYTWPRDTRPDLAHGPGLGLDFEPDALTGPGLGLPFLQFKEDPWPVARRVF